MQELRLPDSSYTLTMAEPINQTSIIFHLDNKPALTVTIKDRKILDVQTDLPMTEAASLFLDECRRQLGVNQPNLSKDQL